MISDSARTGSLGQLGDLGQALTLGRLGGSQ